MYLGSSKLEQQLRASCSLWTCTSVFIKYSFLSVVLINLILKIRKNA